jgi:hypothetical protein
MANKTDLAEDNGRTKRDDLTDISVTGGLTVGKKIFVKYPNAPRPQY